MDQRTEIHMTKNFMISGAFAFRSAYLYISKYNFNKVTSLPIIVPISEEAIIDTFIVYSLTMYSYLIYQYMLLKPPVHDTCCVVVIGAVIILQTAEFSTTMQQQYSTYF